MAATTINDFYLKYVRPDADEPTLMRLSKIATVFWGVVQMALAVAAQWMRQSVLDAGLSVLSVASGAVLGAFLLGTLRPQVGGRAAFAGMLAGIVTMAFVWGFTPIAWTWHALIGAGVTFGVAMAAAPLLRGASQAAAP
jgi:Na+/proline symporter